MVLQWKKILLLQNALLRITRSFHLLSSIWNFMDDLFKPCECLKLPLVIRNIATDRNHLIVYIWWSWGSWFTIGISLEVTEFNISANVVTKMIPFKFLCDVLLRMRARFANVVFSKHWLFLTSARQGYRLVNQKRLPYNFQGKIS